MKVACPGCGVEVVWQGNAFRPFCGKFCRDRDLGRWATEEYRLPEEEPDDGSGKDSA